MKSVQLVFIAALAAALPSAAEELTVDPEVGNNTLTAVFDAKLGERITAVSSAVGCKLSLDGSGAATGSCTVPLTSIRVDNEDTKTEHFQQWVTNKKSEPKTCALEARIKSARLTGPLVAEQPVGFSGEVTFFACGRPARDGRKERIEGTAILFPPGTYGAAKTIRIRARIEKFNRDLYGIGPKHTEGWVARVQTLASVVAEEGTIDLNLFAKAPLPPGK